MAAVKGWSAMAMLLMLKTSVDAFLDMPQDHTGLDPLRRNEDVLPSPHDQLDTQHWNDLKSSQIDRIKVSDGNTSTQRNEYLQENFIHDADNAPVHLATNSVGKYLDASVTYKTQKSILKDEEENIGLINIKNNETANVVSGKIPEGSRPLDEDKFHDTNDTYSRWSISKAFKYGGWARVKSKLLEAVKGLSYQYDGLVLSGVKLLIDYGDKIYYSQEIMNRLDPGLSTLFYDKIRPIMMYLTNILIYFNVVGDDNNLTLDWNDVKPIFSSKTAQVCIAKAQNMIKDYLTVDSLKEYYTTLQLTNPVEARALDFVLNLFPASVQVESGRAFYKDSRHHSYEILNTEVDRYDGGYGYVGDSYDNSGRGLGRRDGGHRRGNGGYGRSDGGYGDSGGDYGHSGGGYGPSGGGHGQSSGGYGHIGGGYGHSMMYPSYYHSDPYLLLAGLGAATLLAYIAHRILVTTTTTTTTTTTMAPAPRKKRSNYDLSDIDNTDLPDILYTINNMVETAAVKYEDKEDGTTDLSKNLNSLWRTRQEKGGCVRCALKDQLDGGVDHLSMPSILM